MREPIGDEDATSRVAMLNIASMETLKVSVANALGEKVPVDDFQASEVLESTIEDTEAPAVSVLKSKSKRRRSSVQQNSKTKIIRKREFSKPPTLTVNKHINKKVSFNHLRTLLLWLLTERNIVPDWVEVTNKPAIEHVVFLFVPGITTEEFGYDDLSNETDPQKIEHTDLSFFENHFDCLIPVRTPGSSDRIYSSYNSLTSILLTAKEKAKLLAEDRANKIYLPDMVLNVEQLLANDYPIHPEAPGVNEEVISQHPLKDGWVATKKFEHDGSKTFSVDCEMCLSAKGRELTRISIVDFNSNVIMDELVRPAEEITDYVTQYSGITKEKLEGVTTTLKDIQERFLAIVSADDILIGHSLNSDLDVMKIAHPSIIDTSIIYEHPRGPPAKASLKYLAATFLDRIIQDSSLGHSSIQDSQTCMDLVKLKLMNGSLFGTCTNEEPIFKLLATVGPQNKVAKTSIVVNDTHLAPRFEKRIHCSDDDEVVDGILKNVNSCDLVIGGMKELELTKGFSRSNSPLSEITVPQALANLNKRLEDIYDGLPNNTALIVSPGIGNPIQLHELKEQCRAYHDEHRDEPYITVEKRWNQEHIDAIKDATWKARDSVAFACIKAASTSDEFAIQNFAKFE